MGRSGSHDPIQSGYTKDEQQIFNHYQMIYTVLFASEREVLNKCEPVVETVCLSVIQTNEGKAASVAAETMKTEPDSKARGEVIFS